MSSSVVEPATADSASEAPAKKGGCLGMLGAIVIGTIAVTVFGIWMNSDSSESRGNVANGSRPAAYDPLEDIWTAYTSHPGNAGQGVDYVNVSGRLLKRGTVPSSAVNSSAKGPLSAYLACYDFVMVMSGLGDIQSDMCIFYVDNPARGTHSIMWKGKQYLGQLEQSMSEYGFTQQ